MNGSTTTTALKQSSSSQKLVEYPPGSNQYTLPKNLYLTRGFSKVQANEEILNETRNQIENNLKRSKDDSTMHINDLSDYSFMLPDLTKYSDEFREFLQQDLIELSALVSLTECGHLNWWSTNCWDGATRILSPMVTSGDGNCLLHAASLAMWGLHDRYLILRKALHSTLEDIKANSPLWRRWKWEQMKQNRKFGLVLNDDEWSKEWSGLLKLSSYQPRMSSNNNTKSSPTSNGNLQQKESSQSNNTTESSSSSNQKTSSTSSSSENSQDGVYFESLEEFHVFVLAHIIQRPIIIVSDTVLHDANGEPLAPIPFGGIYLPLECDLNKCYRYPLVLTYDAAHFSALVLMEDDNCLINENEPPYSIIPITYSNLDLLPIHFSHDPGNNFDWLKYQQIISQDETSSSSTTTNKSSNILNNNRTNNNKTNKLESVNNNNIRDMELNRDQKMNLLQNYLNLVKIQLINQNSVSLIDIHVEQKIVKNHLPVTSSTMTATNNQTKKFSKSNNTLKKILNIFRRDSNLMNGSGGGGGSNAGGSDNKSVSLKHYHQDSYHFNNFNNNNNKKYIFKSWNQLFDTLNSETCILAARLSLEKPPKFDRIIENYIESARNKFDIIKREHKIFLLQQQQQQQQHQSQNLLKQHRCINCKNILINNESCKNCSIISQSEATIITHH